MTDLAMNTGSFAKSAAMVGNAEEHTALSRALSQLAEIEERIDQLHMDQADADFFVLSELIKDYVGMVAAVKVSHIAYMRACMRTSMLVARYLFVACVFFLDECHCKLRFDKIEL